MRTLSRWALVGATALLPSVALAQGLTVQSVVDMRFNGGLGTVMNMAARMGGGSMRDNATTTYLSGHKLRTDTDIYGSIIDLDAERIINIDHKKKSYSVVTFAEMRAALAGVMEGARSEPEKKGKQEAKDSVSIKYSVKVDRTGERAKVAGYDAERVFVTINMEAEAENDRGKKEEVGSMVLLVDQWTSKSAPQNTAYEEFYKTYAQKLGREFRATVQGMQAAFASNPQLKDGFEAAAKELQKVQGIALRTTTHVVLVPAGLTLDRQAVLAEGTASAAKAEAEKKDEKPKGGGFRGMMGAIKAAAENAGSSEDKPAGPPKQTVIMVMSDEVKSISTGAIAGDKFAPPTGYKEVKESKN